jgi:deoxyribodipyrimidine photolyase-like uncharacterized protein
VSLGHRGEIPAGVSLSASEWLRKQVAESVSQLFVGPGAVESYSLPIAQHSKATEGSNLDIHFVRDLLMVLRQFQDAILVKVSITGQMKVYIDSQ